MEQNRIDAIAKTLVQESTVAFLNGDLLVRIRLRGDNDWDITIYDEADDGSGYMSIDGGVFETSLHMSMGAHQAVIEAIEWGG